jgi:hypothetical protein
MLKNSFLLHLRYSRRISCRTQIFFHNHCNIIIPYLHILFQFFLPFMCCIKEFGSHFFSVMSSSKCASCIVDAIKNNQFPYVLDVMLRYWVIGYRGFEVKLHTYFYGAKYSLIFRRLGMRIPGCLETSSTDYQVTRRSLAQ